MADSESQSQGLKLRTARTLKWNTIDRLSSQLLYALTGIVLANVLPREDFGLVGAILVFQAFAILFVDSGFGAALLQKKCPDNRDYSTVFWFNFAVSIIVYVILWFAAPGIADIFQHDARLIPLSRVMFLSFILNGLAIVQTNRLMKSMNVKPIALSNVVGLVVSGAAGIWMAVSGRGVWSLVWQTIILAVIKTGWLWCSERWVPMLCFSLKSLKEIYRVGVGVFTSSFLNTLFLNIYSFVIGAYYTLAALGDYTQADKWSKMGSASISQILTASFIPVLSRYQDDPDKYKQLIAKINGFTAFLLFPVMCGLTVMAEPLFHILFGTKWDTAIPLFQILLIRGIFVVLTSAYNNYILALGHAKSLVMVEVVKDLAIALAIAATLFRHSVVALVWGQLVAGLATYFFVLWLTSRNTGYKKRRFIGDMAPYLLLTALSVAVMWGVLHLLVGFNPCLIILLQALAGGAIYVAVLAFARDRMLADSVAYLFGRFRRKMPVSSN